MKMAGLVQPGDSPQTESAISENIRKELADAQKGWESALDEIASLKREIAEFTRKKLFYRRLNATLWSRLRGLEADLAKPRISKAARRQRLNEEEAKWLEMSGENDPFEEWEAQ